MESFCIDRQILGTDQHLIHTIDGFSWLTKVPEDIWYLTGAMKSVDMCLDTLFELERVNLTVTPPERYVRSMQLVAPDQVIPWAKVMPTREHRAFVRALVTGVEESLAQVSKNYYKAIWGPGNAVLDSMQPAKINTAAWNMLMATRDGNIGALKTFCPKPDGFAPLVVYDRCGTRTGRLKVIAGPNIMTLKADQRGKLLRSRYGNDGAIIMLDFGQLEARVLLYEANRRTEGRDLYQALNSELFDGIMDRDNIKGAIISELYGQGKRALGKRLNMSGKKLDRFVKKVKDHFATRELLSRIKPTFIETGGIRNRHGRWIEIDEPMDHIIINSYAQSTGVDVTILGFHQIIQECADARIVPIFLLHDAIFLDCHLDELGLLQSIANRGLVIPGYIQRFPLRLETVH